LYALGTQEFSARADITASTAALVVSSESGQRWLYAVEDVEAFVAADGHTGLDLALSGGAARNAQVPI
jgi:hypothetical protein